MFQPTRRPPRPPSDDCEITIKNTKQGKKIRIKGTCSKTQLDYAKQSTGIDEVEIE